MSSEVIDWDEAMQQCGDDEEFLRELLDDLRTETETQMAKIDQTIKRPSDQPFVEIMRASHVIKGAASNLMCAQLRLCAMNLETAASNASKDPSAQSNAAVLQAIQARHQELQAAVANYKAYLQQIGV